MDGWSLSTYTSAALAALKQEMQSLATSLPEYPVSVMCAFFAVSRSGYYAFVQRLGRPEKDAALAELIAQQRERSFHTYGYRRMWLWLKTQNIFRNPKTVLRIMKKYDLLSEIRRRRKCKCLMTTRP